MNISSHVQPGGYVGWLRSKVGSAPVQLNFAAACVVENGYVLLQLRSDSGQWGLPGGAVELGESAEDAALREVQEETGLSVRVSHLLGVYSKYEQTYPNGDVAQPITVAFYCDRAGGELSSADAETAAVAWFALSSLPVLWSRLHRDVLADLCAGRQGVFR